MKSIIGREIIQAILPLTGRILPYVSGRSQLRIEAIEQPEGPVRFVNLDENGAITRHGNITRQQIAKIAATCSAYPNYPIHVDRIFSAGGNTRSALETLLAHTPNFFICYPQRIEVYSGEIVANLKHLMWCPDDTHPLGEIAYKAFKQTITEVELGIDFGSVDVSGVDTTEQFESIETRTMHAQIQVALVQIGHALNFRTWVARNDRAIRVKDKTLADLEGVIDSLQAIQLFYKQEIKEAAALIDCIWFTQDLDRIPAIIEIEHSTGVTSGLTRMKKLREAFPALQAEFLIVAPNALRSKVVREANQKIFYDLRARYMPYSTVRELFSLVQRYPLRGIVDHKFVQPFMEKIIQD
jgi:type II restriction enzyme